MHLSLNSEETERLRKELEAKAANKARGVGLRQLKQIWQRLAKGEKAMRVEIWRQGCRMAKQVLYDAFDLNLANPNPNALRRAGSYLTLHWYPSPYST